MKIERVLMTGDTVGGVWTFTMELAEALAARDIEVLLVAFGAKATQAQIAEAASIPGLRLLDSAFRLEWMREPWADLAAAGRWLLKLQNDFKPDVIHLNSYGHGSLPWNSPVVITAHSCVLSWWEAVKGVPAPVAWNRYRELVAQSLTAADLVTTPSEAMASSICRYYGLSRESCRVLPNGRNASKFQARTKEPFIFTAGRFWDEAKNVQAVARIASKLSWPVYVAGDTAGNAATSNPPCTGGCNMLGRLPAAEVAEWYARAAVYVMPAHYEPFGLSILEAALSGCALVLGDIPSLREIWGDAALFIAPGDSDGLQHSIQRFIDAPSARQEMGRRAYARALGFNANRMGGAYFEAFHDAVAASSRMVRSRQCVS
jgi:glycosyltransferase involved in cell wall biosynthesis